MLLFSFCSRTFWKWRCVVSLFFQLEYFEINNDPNSFISCHLCERKLCQELRAAEWSRCHVLRWPPSMLRRIQQKCTCEVSFSRCENYIIYPLVDAKRMSRPPKRTHFHSGKAFLRHARLAHITLPPPTWERITQFPQTWGRNFRPHGRSREVQGNTIENCRWRLQQVVRLAECELPHL